MRLLLRLATSVVVIGALFLVAEALLASAHGNIWVLAVLMPTGLVSLFLGASWLDARAGDGAKPVTSPLRWAHLTWRRAAVGIAITALLVGGMLAVYDLYLGTHEQDTLALVVLLVLGIPGAVLIAGWIVAEVRYDTDDRELR